MSRPKLALLVAVVTGALSVVFLTAGGKPVQHRFVAYRGPRHVGDAIGPNARVAAVDSHGDPTAVISTNGKPPVVWAFELTAPGPAPAGKRIRHPVSSVLAHAACPSPLCPASPPAAPIPVPPPALPVDPCPAVATSEMVALLGPGPVTASSPQPGTCVWSSRSAGVEVEVGGPQWWPYLSRLTALYHPLTGHPGTLADTTDGLRLAVGGARATAILLADPGQSAETWQPIVAEVSAWAASH